jgi:hypothetical protein
MPVGPTSYLSATDVEDLARRLIRDGVEGAKVDFKEQLHLKTAAERGEFAKDLSAIANTDALAHGNFGYIIVGARRGQLVGGVTAWSESSVDGFSAQLTSVAAEFVAPVPEFSLYAFDDADAGKWGVIVIPPSASQPHVCIREVSGNPAKHDMFVRVNDTTSRASAADYARFLQKAVATAARPLEHALQDLTTRLGVLERSGPVADVATLVAALKEQPSAEPIAAGPNRSTADQIRTLFDSPERRVEELLVAEALRLAHLSSADSEQNPWVLPRPADGQLALKLVEHMEQTSRDFATAAATTARYDEAGKLTASLVRAFDVISEEPRPAAGGYWTDGPAFRLYPLVIAIMAVTMVCVREKRALLLGKLFALRLRQPNRPEENLSTILEAVRELRGLGNFFRAALEQRFYEPVAERMNIIVPELVRELVPGSNPTRLFLQAEFVVALAYMDVSDKVHGERYPLPGRYMHAYEAPAAIAALLRDGAWLQTLFPDVEQRLADFDELANKVVSPEAVGRHRGFVRGALDVWKSAKAATSGAS